MDKKFVYDKLATLNLSNLQKNEIYNLVNEVSKNSGGNSGGNSGNTAEPNIIYETDIIMYDFATIEPKLEIGKNLIKTDNLDNPFVKLNLIVEGAPTPSSILIPVQHATLPFIFDGQVLNLDTFTGKHDESYFVEMMFRLGIYVAIAFGNEEDFVKIDSLKVNDVYLSVNNLFNLNERIYDLALLFPYNLIKNQFSEIYLIDSNTGGIVRLNNVVYIGKEDGITSSDIVSITGSYVQSGYLYQAEITISPAEGPTIKITSYPLTPTT